jgi:hypothetical protein
MFLSAVMGLIAAVKDDLQPRLDVVAFLAAELRALTTGPLARVSFNTAALEAMSGACRGALVQSEVLLLRLVRLREAAENFFAWLQKGTPPTLSALPPPPSCPLLLSISCRASCRKCDAA